MPKITIRNLEELKQWIGKEVATSEWLQIDQDRIIFSRPFRQTAPADLNGDRMIDFVSVVDTIKASYTAPSSPSETTAYTILSQAVYGTGPAGRDGHDASGRP